MKRNIFHMISENRYDAVFYILEKEQIKLIASEIICWALSNTETDDENDISEIIGMINNGLDLDCADEFENFIGYKKVDENIDEFMEVAEQMVEMDKKEKESLDSKKEFKIIDIGDIRIARKD